MKLKKAPFGAGPFGNAKGLFFIALLGLAAALPGADVTPRSAPAGLSGSASALSGTAKPKPKALQAWDENQEVQLHGDSLQYFQEDKVLKGDGNVELDAGSLRLRADHIVLDMNSNTLVAEGQVVWADSGNTVYASRVLLDMKTQQGHADEPLFRRDSWVAAGSAADKKSDKELSLDEAQASSCLRERPHYRLVSSSIHVVLGERITAKNVLVYIGLAPLFYLPYYTQSLKDPRPPFEIKPGYNSINGTFIRLAYNYYLNDNYWGSVRFDWMDKTGTGYGLSQHYKLLGGEGEASGYFTRDKNDPENQSWTGNLSHKQDFGQGLKLLVNADLISQYEVNQTYDLSDVDTFQNRKFLSLQSTQKDYSWNFGFNETQQLQQNPNDLSNTADRSYITTQQSLPSFSYSRYAKPLIPGKGLYYALAVNAARNLIVPLTITASGLTSTALGTSYFDENAAFVSTTAGILPSLSYTQRLIRGLALSTNLSFNENVSHRDGESGPAENQSIGNASFSLRVPMRRLVTDLGFQDSREFSNMRMTPFAGLTQNQLSVSNTWTSSDSLSMLASASYNLLPYVVDNDLKRLSLIRVQGLYSPSLDKTLTSVGTYDAFTGQIKTLDTNFTLNDHKKRWETGGGFSWVNNRILQVAGTDPNAPLTFSYVEPRISPDQALLTWRASMVLTEHWSASGYQRLDLASKQVAEQAFSVLRDLHCWNLELYGRDYLSTGWQFGFTLTLKALPQIQASSAKITQDLFNDVSYGY